VEVLTGTCSGKQACFCLFGVAVVGGQFVLFASTATIGGLATGSAALVAIREIVEFISNINNDECEEQN